MPLPVWLVTATPEQLRERALAWFAERGPADGYTFDEVWEGLVGRSYVDANQFFLEVTSRTRPPDPIRVALDALVEAGALRLGYHPRTNVKHWALV